MFRMPDYSEGRLICRQIVSLLVFVVHVLKLFILIPNSIAYLIIDLLAHSLTFNIFIHFDITKTNTGFLQGLKKS